MDGEDIFEIVERVFFDGDDGTVVASVVDEDVDATEAVASFGEDAGAVVGTGEVGREISGGFTASGAIDFGCGVFKFGFGAGGEEDRGAFGDEEARDGTSDAAAGTGDERYLVMKKAGS